MRGKKIAETYKSLLVEDKNLTKKQNEWYIYREYRENIVNWVKNKLNVRSQYWFHLKVKDENGKTIKFKTSMQKDNIVLKIYNGRTENIKTNNGVWAYLTNRQAELLIRELLFYIGANRK